jgi:outer membrane protein assembly factor BamB
MINKLCLSLLATLFLITTLFAADWPQWLGPQRDSVSLETGLTTSWPKEGPPRLWQREVGSGFSGPVIAGDRLIVFHRVEDKEVVECLHPATGKKHWQFDYPTAYEDPYGKGNGPRSTPVIHQKAVITLGAEGTLHCLDLETGKKIWDRQLQRDYQVPPSFFGVGTSPVVEHDLVLINVGGKDAGIVAFALATGKEVWRATQDPASYSSPVIRTIDNTRQAIFFTRTGVVTLDPATGKVLFQKRWRPRIDASVNAATPVTVGDLAFFSTSYDTGALLLKLRKDGADEIWNGDEIMSNHYNTCIHHQGYLYGFEGRQEASPSLRCIDLKTGKIQWTKDRFGCGSMILAQDNLIILTEAGELILAEANPQDYREKARARVLEAPPCRAQIALADGKLFARDQQKLVCLDLRK